MILQTSLMTTLQILGSLHCMSQDIPRVDTNFSTFLFTPLTNSFFLSATSVQEIQDIISSLRQGKAIIFCGPSSIPVPLLKILKFVISKTLEILYIFSFSSCPVPDSFKIAPVIPVYKSGSHLLLTITVQYLLCQFLIRFKKS